MSSLEELYSLDGRVALVTGGTGTLGRAVAAGLAAAGARVAVMSRSLDRAATAAASLGDRGLGLAADITAEGSLEIARQTLLETWGRLDILVNFGGGNTAAATLDPAESIFDRPVDSFREVVDINLLGTLLPIRVFGPSMVAGEGPPGGASIVTVASVAGVRPLTRVAGYSAAKSGVINLTRWLAVDLARRHPGRIRANALVPGFFAGTQNRSLLFDPEGRPTERGRRILEGTPMGRFGAPDELVGAVVWLSGPSASYVTGSVITVDGGFTADSGV